MRKSTLKICAMLLAFCTATIHLQAMDEWDGKTIAKGFYSGTGTKANPYKIFTASQFLYFIQQTKDGNTFSGKYIELCNDITFSHEAIGGGDFYGNFDGNDHTIQVNEYWSETGWTLFGLYGSMHDVQFVRANTVMHIYTGGILYNCRFEYPNNSYHGYWTVYLNGGTIANCVSNSAYYKNSSKYGGSYGLVYGNQSSSLCSNCYFPITSYSYGNTLADNYYGVIESCGEEAGNDWVQSHTERAYKSWPLTFNPTYSEYQIKEQPQTYNPSVVCPNSDEALYQWYYQKREPITFEDITSSYSTQTKTIVVSDDDVVLSFDFEAHGYVSGRYDDNYVNAWISVNGEKIVSVSDERAGTYSCQASAGTTYEISCYLSDISNIRIIYPTETLENETSSVLSKQTIMEKSGAYFCQVSYGKDCDVMCSDYVNYEKLLTIDNVTYVINEDNTATVLWVADMAVNITIPETVYYDDVNYPVTSISSKAFVECTSLASIKCKTLDAPAILGGTTFEGLAGVFIPSNITLYVPIGYESAYSAADGWKGFGMIVGMEMAVELIDGQTYDNNKNKIVEKISYTRTLNNTEWNALYLPFEVPVSQLLTDYEVAYINAVHSYDDDDNGEIDRMSMEVIKIKNGILHANHPYMIKARNEEAKQMNITVTGATLHKSENVTLDCSSIYTKYEITGIYNKMTGSELNGCYALSGGSWKQIASNSYLNPFRMYLRITPREGSPYKVSPLAMTRISIHVKGEEGSTSIEELLQEQPKEEIIYDLMGRRVVTPVKGQIYIVGGKKRVY